MLKRKRIVIALLVFALVFGQLSSSLAVDVEEPTGCNTQAGYSANAGGARIGLHEIGHALGVAHCHETSGCRASCANNVMAPTLAKGVVKRTLAAYDTASLQVIYCMNHPLP